MNDRRAKPRSSFGSRHFRIMATVVLVLVICCIAAIYFVARKPLQETVDILSGWYSLDSWIVGTAAIAAMACALPGNFLVLRRQSMMGDAISHTVLPGIVMAFLFSHWLLTNGWIDRTSYSLWQHSAMFSGAIAMGIFSALLTEWVQKLGRVESSAALGVVFTTLFAVGLLLIRIATDDVHIDPDCVLYGNIETVVLGADGIPTPTIVVSTVLATNLILTLLFFKELRIASFDPQLATTMGINARFIHYSLMAVTAATLVAAFESVGSILVISMLIAPPSTAYLLTDRLSHMIVISMTIAIVTAIFGHALALTVPPILFGRLGFTSVTDASTAGMITVAAGILFVTAACLGPRHGLLSQFFMRVRLGLRIAREDILGALYRREEKRRPDDQPGTSPRRSTFVVGPLLSRLAHWQLAVDGDITAKHEELRLTSQGRLHAQHLIRSHRLWESYVEKHFDLPDDHLHESAERAEHYIDPTLQEQLLAELDHPEEDPHGRSIPPE
ncbi:MAG: metal ABC transporter permease [Pirellulaceae bacterium]|nr:metal ABC transporter permease [Pirellulaceae bacterium]